MIKEVIIFILLFSYGIFLAQEPEENSTSDVDTTTVDVDSMTMEKEKGITLLGDESDGSRAQAVHLIPMYDERGSHLLPNDSPQLPFSTKETCKPCHSYEILSSGWHFNASDSSINPGRPGHPWILTDATTATQFPLSYRNWPGVNHPQDIGLTPFTFVQQFAGQYPGGGVGENDSSEVDPDLFSRWDVSGRLDINCLACHESNSAHDQTEYFKQVRKQNFRWATTATCAFATVTGSAKKMQLSFDYTDGVGPRTWIDLPPRVYYKNNTFDVFNKVFFDLSRQAINDRCYFCHTTVHKGNLAKEKWQTDEDIHLTSGMICVDCHRNGLDHMMVRGYEGEADNRGIKEIKTLTCKGCHIGSHEKIPQHGRLSAPKPKHTGIPTIHFEKMSCTTCHSGPWPHKEAQLVQTSIAHGLGNHGIVKADTVLPYIMSPVYSRGQNGKIEPHHLFYPAFWGIKKESKIQPLHPDLVKPFVETVIQADTLTDSLNYDIIAKGQWPHLTEDKILAICDFLSESLNEGKAVYVSGGYVFYASENKLLKEEHDIAKPYSWAFAHDVRPAAQSLGSAKGCKDCHRLGSGFNFGRINIPSIAGVNHDDDKAMSFYQKTGGFYSGLFAFTFYFRPILKIILVCCCLLLFAVLTLYAFKGLDAVIRAGSGLKNIEQS